jgi:putative endonuclease
MGAYVYMLRCADNSFYVGCATGDDLGPRIAQHEVGAHSGYTLTRRPVHLVWSEHFDRITDAIAIERKIKGWSRAKKVALISGDWTKIQQLAKRRAGRPKPPDSSS